MSQADSMDRQESEQTENANLWQRHRAFTTFRRLQEDHTCTLFANDQLLLGAVICLSAYLAFFC